MHRGGALQAGVSALSALSVVVVAGCGTQLTAGSEPSPAATVTVTVEPTESPVETSTPTPRADPTRTPTLAGETADSGVLEESVSGQSLSLADVFEAQGEWTESRFSVSDRSDLRGLGVPVTCYTEPSLELRLARRFSTLEFSVGQANDSPSSDSVLVIEVVANNEQLDLRRVPFDQVQPLELPIDGANAVVVKLSVDEPCNNSLNRVIAVVESLTVS